MKTDSQPGSLPAGISFPERTLARRCPVCEAGELTLFCEATDVPVLSTIVLASEQEALACQRGDVKLAHCCDCGFVFNVEFDPSTQEFSDRYEDSQTNSPTFGGYAGDLVRRLCDRFQLQQKTILELGCGKGEFLAALCRSGDNRGIGIDPAFDSQRLETSDRRQITAVAELLQEGHGDLVRQADFICCRHTLEHIGDPLEFLRRLRKLMGTRRDVPLFCDVPCGEAALRHGAFWEVFYEHSSYFGESSFAQLFRSAGFAITDLRREYGGQYLVVEAVPGDLPEPSSRVPIESEPEMSLSVVDEFRSKARTHIAHWRGELSGASRRPTVLWGSGSRAVAILSMLRCSLSDVSAVVDINPRRWNRFMPGVVQPIISPDDQALREIERVIVLNPVYRQEIQNMLLAQGVTAEVIAV